MSAILTPSGHVSVRKIRRLLVYLQQISCGQAFLIDCYFTDLRNKAIQSRISGIAV